MTNTAVLTGSYNEYGYVVRKNGRIIHAAGNCPQESQTYIGIEEDRQGYPRLVPLTEDANVLPLEAIIVCCETILEEAHKHPDWYGLKGDHLVGDITYQKSLNPLEAAYKCGALTR